MKNGEVHREDVDKRMRGGRGKAAEGRDEREKKGVIDGWAEGEVGDVEGVVDKNGEEGEALRGVGDGSDEKDLDGGMVFDCVIEGFTVFG